MKSNPDKLQAMICIPWGMQPVKVRATDGEHTEIIEFGRHVSKKTIMDRLPIVFMDRVYNKRRTQKKRGA